ncbi:MAG: putative ABC transporter permease [Tissierellia bacterium]|nr:putative ABC transporter permease [Tissierellia bacterium]
MYPYLLYFFIYALLGWMAEVAFAALQSGSFVNRGFLNGPLCPIYGFGALGVVYVLEPLEGHKLLLFFAAMALATAVELVAGWLLEVSLQKRWWDYSQRRFNFMGYICLEFSVLWGLLGFFVFEALHPALRGLVALVPTGLGKLVVAVACGYLAVDFVATVQSILKLNRRLERVQRVAADIRRRSDALGIKIASNTVEFTAHLEELREDVQDQEGSALRELRALVEEHNGLIREGRRSHRRLLRAFPNMKSKKFEEALKKLKGEHPVK